jgi:sortase A
MFARVLGAIGRTMIAAGVLLLLFVGYQLWGTGYRTDLAQNELRDKFQNQLQRVAAGQSPVDEQSSGGGAPSTLPGGQTEDPVGVGADGGPNGTGPDGSATTRPRRTTTSTTERDPNDTTPTTRGPGDETDANLAVDTHIPRVTKGQPISRIEIPKIGSDFVAIEGVDLPLLTEGPGHFPGTAFPGQPGNAAFAGHRVTYKAPFNRIDELVPGDKVTVTTVQGTFTYEVMPQAQGLGYYIVSPSDLSILEDRGDNRLTLMACHPKYDLAQRIVVTAKLVGTPADGSVKGSSDQLTLPGADGGTDFSGSGEVASGAVLVGSDESARVPAVLFSLAALAVWLVAYLVGRKWKKWPAYLIATPFFLILLWFAFDFINRTLPAAY